MLIDLDFKYSYDVTERQHNDEMIWQIIDVYITELATMVSLPFDTVIDVYVMHKNSVARLEDKGITKDGIHIIIGLNIDVITKQILRKRLIAKLQPVFAALPLTNSMDDVIDLTICKGTTNWQLFGSRKPGNEAYELVQHFVISFDSNDGEFMMDEKNIHEFDIKQHFQKLSIQYDKHPKFEMNPKIIDIFDEVTDLDNKGRSKEIYYALYTKLRSQNISSLRICE
jgi:hypothetical protein